MSKFNLGIVGQKFQQLKQDLPKVMANDAQKFFAKSFRDSGFTDTGLTKWKPRKNDKDKGRAILVKSGNLRRAVNDSIESVSFDKTVLAVRGAVGDYAVVHNYGKGKMPKRKFMGHSKTLEKLQLDKIKKAMRAVFK